MNIKDAEIGMEVVKAKGDNIGVVSVITDIDVQRGRMKTDFGFWAKCECFEPAYIPFEIIPGYMKRMKNKNVWVKEKYIRK